MRRTGTLFILSAPSGAGKTTLCNRLRAKPEFVYSISCTTRKPRTGEVDGGDYWFVDEATFKKRRDDGFFIEHAEVHGNFYGTPLQPIKDAMASGKDVLLDIDVQGAQQIRAHKDPAIQVALVDVFLMTETVQELERRLNRRGTDDPATIKKRLANSTKEMTYWNQYRYVILSGSAEDDEKHFRSIVEAERMRTSRTILGEFK
jgi:guanylate kinase